METDKILLNVANRTIRLMNKHGLLDKNWSFGFNGSKSAFGMCCYDSKLISLSRQFCICNYRNNMESIIDTILHEIAHALTYIQDPTAPNHGKLWKSIFISIGGNGKTKVMPEDKVRAPLGKYVYQCPKCHGVIEKDYKSHILACKFCCDDYNDGFWDEKYVCKLIKIRKNIPDNHCFTCLGEKTAIEPSSYKQK